MADQQEKLSISQLACTSVGVEPITSFEEGSAASIVLAQAYEPVVESEISLYKWRFATEYYNLKPNLLLDIPLSRFNNAYQLPTSPAVMSIDTVLIDDKPIRYERRKNQIHTRDTADDDVILQYRFRADETTWYPFFRMLIVYRLATICAFSVTRNSKIADSMKELADQHWRRAKTESAQAQTNQRVNLSKLSRGRRGAVNRFWRDR
jgi:hypothetical protein